MKFSLTFLDTLQIKNWRPSQRDALRIILIISPFLLISCFAGSAANRTDHALEIAKKGGLFADTISAPPFILRRFSRITDPTLPIHLYIEGDGAAWISRHEPALNPTPSDPVGLNLALKDSGPNVIYLGRPCQFVSLNTPGQNCTVRDWTSHRFGPRVMNAYQNAIDIIVSEINVQKSMPHPRNSSNHSAPTFDIIGYSGGAYIALILAGSRRDIQTLRTVAGNVDNTAFTTLHQISAMPDTVPLTNIMRDRLSHIPQQHFVGSDDTTIPQDIALSYQSTLPSSSCIQISIIPGVNHHQGWIDIWPAFLQKPLLCNVPK